MAGRSRAWSVGIHGHVALPCRSSCVCDGTLGAQGPVGHLGLVDREAVVVGRGQARCGADCAVHVGDRTARPAHDVVVVVPHPGLVARHRARRLDAPQQTGGGQGAKHVVHGLMGHLAEILPDDADDRVRVGVRMIVHRGQHRHPRPRHPQSRPTQHALEVGRAGHAKQYRPFSGISKDQVWTPGPRPAAARRSRRSPRPSCGQVSLFSLAKTSGHDASRAVLPWARKRCLSPPRA